MKRRNVLTLKHSFGCALVVGLQGEHMQVKYSHLDHVVKFCLWFIA